jgi:hypothetical protein
MYDLATKASLGSFASGLNNAMGLAFDAAGNLYTTDGTIIRKFTPDGVGSVFATPLAWLGNPSSPRGRAFDAEGPDLSRCGRPLGPKSGQGNPDSDQNAATNNEDGICRDVEPALALADSADEKPQTDAGDDAAEILSVSSRCHVSPLCASCSFSPTRDKIIQPPVRLSQAGIWLSPVRLPPACACSFLV